MMSILQEVVLRCTKTSFHAKFQSHSSHGLVVLTWCGQHYNVLSGMIITSLIKNNIILAKKSNDLLMLNSPAFDNAIDDIYPPELQLKKTTECPTTLSYLDILISHSTS